MTTCLSAVVHSSSRVLYVCGEARMSRESLEAHSSLRVLSGGEVERCPLSGLALDENVPSR